MASLISGIFGTKVGKTRVVPVTTKILIVFILIILVSNLSSNYINLIFNRTELVKQMKQLLAKDLRDIYNFADNQYEIYDLTGDRDQSIDAIVKKANHELNNDKALVSGIRPSGNIVFFASQRPYNENTFSDTESLKIMKDSLDDGVNQGFLPVEVKGNTYFTAYKYNEKWDMFILRAEEENQFYSRQREIFTNVSIIIIIITILSALVGGYLLRYILRFVRIITNAIMKMSETQQLETINLKGASNDDITYLGASFNALSNTVNNLITIFRKFANQDIVNKAYRDRHVKLEGTQKNLTMLFSDIKSFTFITETLGTDIIKLLNLHYDRAIREIINHDGVIGAIIGDALLAVFGALEGDQSGKHNRSYQSVAAAYELQRVAQSLRDEMAAKREQLKKSKGKLSTAEEKVYKAVLLEIGVGIDRGDVFYGTLGSYVRMTNTVIGDKVNSASRLEGLTRVYKAPVIISEAVKADIEENVPDSGIMFVELDQVLVKGKTVGTKVYWPILPADLDEKTEKDVKTYEKGLELYYKGKWQEAHRYFTRCKLEIAKEFRARTKSGKAPPKWNGIWEMKTK